MNDSMSHDENDGPERYVPNEFRTPFIKNPKGENYSNGNIINNNDINEEGRLSFSPSTTMRQLPRAPPRSAEKFCGPKTGVAEYDESGKTIAVFGRKSISKDLAMKLAPCAAYLDLRIYSETKGQQKGHGAVSLIEFDDTAGQRQSLLITAKHNAYGDSKTQETCTTIILNTQADKTCPIFAENHICLNDVHDSKPIDLVSMEGELEVIQWQYGFDILTHAPSKIVQIVLDDLSCFSLASSNFEFEKGQKVGIVTWNDQGATLETVKSPSQVMSPGLINSQYGSRNDVNLYTGEIMAFGENHIEHNINTYSGCSGSLIFLLDKDQPDSVGPDDFGKVIAIHVGSKKELEGNVGLKLVGTGAKPLTEYEV